MVTLFITIAGFLLAWLTFQKTFITPDVSEERNNLLGVFITTQKLHLEVQSIMQKYIDDNDGANHLLYENVTFYQMLELYKQAYEKELSEKVFQDLKNNSIYTKSNFATFQRLIDKQHDALLQFRSQLLTLKQ